MSAHIDPEYSISFRETLRLIRSDYRRYARQYELELTLVKVVGFTIMPQVNALLLYRLSHWAYFNGLRPLAWLLYSLKTALTGVDIVPRAIIGDGCFLGHAVATMLSGRIGRNATLYARVGVGGGTRHQQDIGSGPGLPIVGDDVTIGVDSMVMGPWRIGDGAYIGSKSLVMGHVPPGAIVMGIPARIVGWTDGREVEGDTKLYREDPGEEAFRRPPPTPAGVS